MENESILDSGANPNDLLLNEQMVRYILETSKWAKFLSIMGFIFIGLMVLVTLNIGVLMGTMANDMPGPMGAISSSFIVIFYLGFALLYFFPTLYLYKYAVKAKRAIQDNDDFEMTEAFGYMKSVFKFWGIFTIVILSFYVLILVFALAGAGMFMG